MTDFFDVVERLELPLEKDAFETLNGFLISLLDKIPNDGETAQLHAYGYTFEVLEVKDKIIRRVRVIKDGHGAL
jgi:putative hemolysin